ncbi:hypothetical protein O6H91_07G013300 [Diphasiastrum complanatum]|uniref:Uncharacterized protein n=2 Tax=Diphasiastrum complanatum TaxID=34168 RepID=A0ACC2D2D2_DIPCM|nr:hypothetical protein O6H91_07G013300 [Diphasiastrum complanatum]KAJ7548460.1 hypothetical protein O6H91_07G013300 [Diphasiastrum complanatum]
MFRSCNMRRLRMNKPSPHELASLSLFPSLNKSNMREPSRIEPKWNQQHLGASTAGSDLPSRSSFLYSSPQSQKSCYSQGLSQSQTTEQFSQNSQEDFGTTIVDQRYILRGRELALKRPSPQLPPCGKRSSLNETSKLSIASSSTAHDLIQRIKSNTWPDHKCHLSEEVEKRMDVMERLMTDICQLLENMEKDLTHSKASANDTFSEVEASREKVIRQQDALQSQLREQEEITKRLFEMVTTIPEKICEEMVKSRMQELENTMKEIPQVIVAKLAFLKLELVSAIQTQLQKFSELESKRQAWITETSHLNMNGDISGKPAIVRENSQPRELVSLQSSDGTFCSMGRRHQDYQHLATRHPEKKILTETMNLEAFTHVDLQSTLGPGNLNHTCTTPLASGKILRDNEGWIERTSKRSCSVGEPSNWEGIKCENSAVQRSKLVMMEKFQTETARSNSQAVNADMDEDYSLGFLNTDYLCLGKAS